MLCRTILTLLAHTFSVVAQNAVPTNSTLPAGLALHSELLLSYDDQNMATGPQYNVDFALDASGAQKSNSTELENVFVNSNMSIITPFNINSLANGSIAYISCDPDVYSQSELKVSDTIQAATKKITVQDPEAGAIVLYSVYSSWCNYTETGSYNYTNVFILPGQGSARSLQSSLHSATSPQLAQIYNPNVYRNGTSIGSGGDSSNDNNDGGNVGTPSTTVAMIILYSVTGIITLCFVVVIVSGAMRARRHPERYGLLNLPVNAHQRRARGIARAMLETIPIVKFGEKEPAKMSSDVEQGREMHPVTRTEAPAQEEEKGVLPDTDEQSSTERASSSATNTNSTETQAPEDTEADNGLACSVCTEDFVKGQDLRVLPCNHKFHPECIDPWLLNVSGTCPLCRVDLRPPGERGDDSVAQTEGVELAGPADLTSQPGFVPYQAPRFSMFLNRRRMMDSTPAQRLRVLRALRNHQRNDGAAPNTTDAPDTMNPASAPGSTDENISRSNRVSRFFGRGGEGTATPPS